MTSTVTDRPAGSVPRPDDGLSVAADETGADRQAADILRIEEQLRQVRETFDLRKKQDERWFSLRLTMGYAAVVMIPLIAIICSVIIFNNQNFSSTTVSMAAAGLLVDILGLMGALWKVVLNSGTVTKLEPIVIDNSSS